MVAIKFSALCNSKLPCNFYNFEMATSTLHDVITQADCVMMAHVEIFYIAACIKAIVSNQTVMILLFMADWHFLAS